MSTKPREITAPPTFRDRDNRIWTIDLSLDLADRVLTATQVDLLPDDNDPSKVVDLIFRRKRLGSVLWECCREQAEGIDVDREHFFKALDGKALTSGWGALIDSIIFFTQQASPTVARQIAELVEAEMRVIEAGATEIVSVIQSSETSTAIQDAVTAIGNDLRSRMAEELVNSVTNTEESSASIRGRIRSAS